MVYVAACLFNTDDAVQLCELGDSGGRDVYARARRHVVGDDRELGGFCDRLVMLDNAFLRAFVVIRSDDERAVRAERFYARRLLSRRCGAVTARADDNGHASRRLFDYKRRRFFVLGWRDGRGLARCSERNERGHAARDKVLYVPLQNLVIDLSVRAERRDHRRAAAVEYSHGIPR